MRNYNRIIETVIPKVTTSISTESDEVPQSTEKAIDVQTVTTENTSSTSKPTERITLVDIVTRTIPTTTISTTPKSLDIATSENPIDNVELNEDKSPQTSSSVSPSTGN